MSEWEWKTLGDIASEGYGLVDGPFGSNLPASCYVESGIPVIRGSNLTLGSERFVANEFVYVSEETAQSLERSLARPNDIIFTKKGTIGQTGLVASNLQHDVYLISSNQMKLTVDESIADPIFVYYYVSSKSSQNKIKRDSEFTGVPKTNTKYLREFPIYLPSLPQQKQIARTLDSLDRKIENLRRQNETLEAIAQTLFKHWFVDFEFPNADGKPYKSSGGAMEPSELGEIPAGWRVGVLGDIATNIRDSISQYDIEPGMSYIALEHMPRKRIALDSWGTAADIASNKFIFKKGNILFGKLRPYFHKVGVAFISGICSTDILVLDAKHKNNFGFLLMVVSSKEFIRYVSLAAEGTRMPRTNWQYMQDYLICIPDNLIMSNFNDLVKSCANKMSNNIFQLQTLILTRDVLLPKLMSGQLRIT